ncbi:MAG TPA: P-loop NTPase [Methanoregulaceae archaeon]|nr:P-loop NTPase [Methanoregulaceae archaeon]
MTGKKIIIVYSPGGGNGKSEIAANLAYSLAKEGHRTWMIDANTYAPTLDMIFGVPINGNTFSEFLMDTNSRDIPWYDLSLLSGKYRDIPLYLTPSNRAVQEVRFRMQEVQNSGDDLAGRIPESVFHKLDDESIDYLIVDTHPGFELINDIWLGMTEFLLLVSRINDLDLANLKAILQEGNVTDIAYKLIVFNNVIVNEQKQAVRDMEAHEVIDRLEDIHEQEMFENCISEYERLSGNDCGVVDVYDEPFLYSEKLASWGQFFNRHGLFVEAEKDDPFSRGIEELSRYIVGL